MSLRCTKLAVHPSSGNVYAFGGYLNDVLSNDLIVFAVNGNCFKRVQTDCGALVHPSPVAALPSPRVHHACCISGNALYIYGGIDARRRFLSDLWCFSFESRKWSQVVTLMARSRLDFGRCDSSVHQ